VECVVMFVFQLCFDGIDSWQLASPSWKMPVGTAMHHHECMNWAAESRQKSHGTRRATGVLLACAL